MCNLHLLMQEDQRRLLEFLLTFCSQILAGTTALVTICSIFGWRFR